MSNLKWWQWIFVLLIFILIIGTVRLAIVARSNKTAKDILGQ
jgi:Sec-independent protein translocase protein TatA